MFHKSIAENQHMQITHRLRYKPEFIIYLESFALNSVLEVHSSIYYTEIISNKLHLDFDNF